MDHKKEAKYFEKFLIVPPACAMVMKREFNYWGLDEISLQPCCALKFYPEMVNCAAQTELDTLEKIKEEELIAGEKFGSSKLAQIRLCFSSS